MFKSSTTGKEFGTIGGTFDHRLFLIILVHMILVPKMNNTSDRFSREHAIHKICIVIMSEYNLLSARFRRIFWKIFHMFIIYSVHPIVIKNFLNASVVGFINLESNLKFLKFAKKVYCCLNLQRCPIWGYYLILNMLITSV